MLTENELLIYFNQLNLSSKARHEINRIRNSPPAELAKSGITNVVTRYPSAKQGCTIQARNHRIQLPAIYLMEYDDDVLEYWDYPGPVKHSYQTKSGKASASMYQPAFFVLRTNSAGWEDWQSEHQLKTWSDNTPARYIKSKDSWQCPPGEKFAEKYGFHYRVHSDAEISWPLQRNLIFLEDYLRGDYAAVSDVAAEEIITLVRQEPGILLENLIRGLEQSTSDDIYKMIVEGRIWGDLDKYPLAEIERFPVFLNAKIGRAYIERLTIIKPDTAPAHIKLAPNETVVWDGKRLTIANIGEKKLWLKSEQGETVSLQLEIFQQLVQQNEITGIAKEVDSIAEAGKEILRQASQADHDEAINRLDILNKIDKGIPLADDEKRSERTLRTWRSRRSDAKSLYGDGYIGLIPDNRMSGNRNNKISDESNKTMLEIIEKEYENPTGKTIQVVYGEYLKLCDEQGLEPASYTTFRKRVRHRPVNEQHRKRQGSKVAYQDLPWYLEYTTPRHGDRAFEICHLDHSPISAKFRSSGFGGFQRKPLDTGYLSLLRDAFTRKILVEIVMPDPPSFVTNMMVIRECVRRYNRVPQILVMDNGSDFKSVYFQRLLARYGCTVKYRPKSAPRFGNVVESAFGITEAEFIQNLAGNTLNIKNNRQITKTVDPAKLAEFTLGSFYNALHRYNNEYYAHKEHPALGGMTPDEAYHQSLAVYGARDHRLIVYDEAFILDILPTTEKGTAKVQPGKGVKINYLYYWTEEFRRQHLEGTSVPVRFDPWNIGIAYAYTKKLGWVECRSEYNSILRGRTQRELLLASEELRRRRREHRKNYTVSARRLADFLASIDSEETLEMQRFHDIEMRSVLGQMGLAVQSPMEEPPADDDVVEFSDAVSPNQDVYDVEDTEDDDDDFVYGSYDV